MRTRHERALAALLAATVALPVAAAVLIAVQGHGAEDDEDFQKLAGGLGLGAATELSPCASRFDPRVEPPCSLRHEPLPLGSLLCPGHAGD